MDDDSSPNAPRSAAASLVPFFEPATVAVIGVSRQRGSVGTEIFHNLIDGGFSGRVFAVNPKAEHIGVHMAYPSVRTIPDTVDLAIVAVPAASVEGVVEDCVAKGVPAIVVVSAGFRETGPRGAEAEARLRDRVRAAGIRMIGPNCLGLVNANPAVRLNASFSPVFPPAGSIAFSSQSGAIGLAILDYARRLNLGISTFVSVGNKADVSTNDLLEYWETDARTNVVLLYVESFGNPRRFGRIARRVAERKPIVAVKAGRSRAGARAATSHTGALAATDTLVDALFADAGVIRTDTIEELFDVAALLAHQPLPRGRRVAILTNAGGPGILAADACEALGLELPSLAATTVAALRAFLPSAASLTNPIDMIATAPADHYRQAIALLLGDPGVDGLVTIYIPPLVTRTSDIARAVAGATRGSSKPVLATFFGAEGAADLVAPVPCYTFPESAVRALAHAVRYSQWRGAPRGTPFALPEPVRQRARTAVAHALANASGWLSPSAAIALLEGCGVRVVPTLTVADEAGAVAALNRFGSPVVVKGAGATVVHKTEAHAVRTDLADPDAVRRAYREVAALPGVSEVLVQPMVRGVEMMVGSTRDTAFGHAVVCGSGGTDVELTRDTACRLAPLTEDTARAMLGEVTGVARLRGFRGAAPLDEAALRDVVLRVSALVDACPEIAELDLNPVVVTADGVWAVDVRVRVASPERVPM